MDKVKKKLKHLLREGNSAPEQFAWPKDMPEPSIVMTAVVELLKFHRRVMRYNLRSSALMQLPHSRPLAIRVRRRAASSSSSNEKPLTATSIQARWVHG